MTLNSGRKRARGGATPRLLATITQQRAAGALNAVTVRARKNYAVIALKRRGACISANTATAG